MFHFGMEVLVEQVAVRPSVDEQRVEDLIVVALFRPNAVKDGADFAQALGLVDHPFESRQVQGADGSMGDVATQVLIVSKEPVLRRAVLGGRVREIGPAVFLLQRSLEHDSGCRGDDHHQQASRPPQETPALNRRHPNVVKATIGHAGCALEGAGGAIGDLFERVVGAADDDSILAAALLQSTNCAGDQARARKEPRSVTKFIFPCGMSRSGTTLLAAILDSHPRISMGYELLPAGLPTVAEMDQVLAESIAETTGDARPCADAIKTRGFGTLATFVKRCDRACVTPGELRAICRRLLDDGWDTVATIETRTRLSLAVVEVKMRKEGTSFGGFKINAPSIETFDAVIPGGRYIYIVRDPRDVVASHFANDFGRTIEHITRAWMQYTTRFRSFADAHADRAMLIRYEDLVRHPGRVLDRVFEKIGVPFSPDVLRFFESKASVHHSGHTNSDDLERDFYDTSIQRWARELTLEQIREVQAACDSLMPALGYELAPTAPSVPLKRLTRMAKRAAFSRKRRFYRDEYEEILGPYVDSHVNLTWREAAAGEQGRGRDILMIRHDVDHDYETALRMARWEEQRGLRATYCILHSAWYYGRLVDGRMQRSREVVELCRDLQSMGHEINLHNNFAVMALEHGLDAVAALKEELLFLRMHGIEVAGTSTHGDRLCRELAFRNYELFSESVYASRGGPRVVEHRGNRVELGAVSMSEFGLEYEAYDIPRDRYVTDSGGSLRVRQNTRGRGGLRRKELDRVFPYGEIVGTLTHPVWWDFQRDAPPGREARSLPELLAEGSR